MARDFIEDTNDFAVAEPSAMPELIGLLKDAGLCGCALYLRPE